MEWNVSRWMQRNNVIRKSFSNHFRNNAAKKQTMLKLMGKFLRNGIYIVLKYLPTRYLLITKGKIETVHWIILADTVNQVTKANMHSNGANGLLCASWYDTLRRIKQYSLVFLPKIYNLHLNIRKISEVIKFRGRSSK